MFCSITSRYRVLRGWEDTFQNFEILWVKYEAESGFQGQWKWINTNGISTKLKDLSVGVKCIILNR